MSNKIEALLFDFGGVITEIDFSRTYLRWAEDAGCDVGRIAERMSFDRAYERQERAEIGTAEYFAHLRTVLDIAISDDQFLDGWNAIFVGEMPGIAELLTRAKARYPLYAFTNTNPAHEAVWSVRYADLLKIFDHVFVSSAIGLRKPDRAAFDHVVREIGVPAAHILFFDDSLANVEGARAAGLQAVHVTGPDTVAQTLATLGL